METAQKQESYNINRLFYGSCFALITTAFSFSIRAGILPELAETFDLTASQLGTINSMWFLGFPITMIIGGLTYHTIGPKRFMQFAFLAHTVGIILTVYSGGYAGLILSTLLIGLGNGCTEAACNPMLADSSSGKRMSTLLNRFHMWFPGGIVLGSLIGYAMQQANLGWQAQIWILMIPTVIYAYMFYGQVFPKPKSQDAASLMGNIRGMGSPLFLFIAVCMMFTAISEFGPTQWAQLVLAKSGAEPLLIMALIFGIMAVGRYFGGEFVAKFDQTGVLLGSSVFTAIGIFLLATLTGSSVYLGAVVFAVGVCYFWPNMIGFVAEKVPSSGALGMSVVGAIGMFFTGNLQPIIGRWIDAAREEALAMGLTGDALELAAGQATLKSLITFPLVLIVLFTILYVWVRRRRAAG